MNYTHIELYSDLLICKSLLKLCRGKDVMIMNVRVKVGNLSCKWQL